MLAADPVQAHVVGGPPDAEFLATGRQLTDQVGQALVVGVAAGLGAQQRDGGVRRTVAVLFGQLWERPELSPRDRSLVTVASLVTSGSTEQLVYHLGLAKQNGASEQELIEVITHLAFYAGWPKAMSAMTVAKKVFGSS
jgi:4-carboxymuconolactone decarboxylase